MKSLKIGILKKIILDSKGHFRFYPAGTLPHQTGSRNKHLRPKTPVIDLMELPEIRTEKDLLWFMYQNWGSGEYIVRYFGGPMSTFWKGEINERGFKFYKNVATNKEVEYWKKERAKELMEGDIAEAEFTKELLKEAKEDIVKKKKYGFRPYLTASGRRGEFTLWSEVKTSSPKQEDWGWNPRTDKQKFEKWGDVKKEKYEKW